MNKPVEEHSQGASVNQSSIIYVEPRVDSNEQSIPVCEQHEIINEPTQANLRQVIHDNAILISNNNNILFT